jgi:DNA-directed RNA polymerase subunit M/transcription elongation factor TFIIS
MVQKYEQMEENDIMVNILVDCIDYLYDDDQVYYAKDSSRKELEEFVDSMQQKDLEKIRMFFDTMPEIKKDFEFDCPKCGYKEDMVVKGLQNFFA